MFGSQHAAATTTPGPATATATAPARQMFIQFFDAADAADAAVAAFGQTRARQQANFNNIDWFTWFLDNGAVARNKADAITMLKRLKQEANEDETLDDLNKRIADLQPLYKKRLQVLKERERLAQERELQKNQVLAIKTALHECPEALAFDVACNKQYQIAFDFIERFGEKLYCREFLEDNDIISIVWKKTYSRIAVASQLADDAMLTRDKKINKDTLWAVLYYRKNIGPSDIITKTLGVLTQNRIDTHIERYQLDPPIKWCEPATSKPNVRPRRIVEDFGDDA